MAHNSPFSHPTYLPNLVMFPSAAREFRAGLLALAPLLVGVMPFGMIYGALALSRTHVAQITAASKGFYTACDEPNGSYPFEKAPSPPTPLPEGEGSF
jgi:hypothetical protein